MSKAEQILEACRVEEASGDSMQEIADLAAKGLDSKRLKVPEISVSADDAHAVPRVVIEGSIPQGSKSPRYTLHVSSAKSGAYKPGMKVTAGMFLQSDRIKTKFRKTTATPEKVIAKIRDWVEAARDEKQ